MGQGYATNGVSVGVQASGVDAASAAAAVPRDGARHAGHPPLLRPPPRQCPRCRSANTKFCYYNNYSRAQPRYLCKACRRHWTEGGTLRDVPVGGGRKNKRGGGKGGAKVASTASASATAAAAISSGGGANAFPDILWQMLFQPATAVGGGGYNIDLSAWQQMAAATTPQGAGDVGAVGATAPDSNCGGVQYWNGWQQDDMPGLDGA